MPEFRYLKDDVVVRKIAQLQTRIQERFPERNLPLLCTTLYEIALDTQNRLTYISKPNWWLRGVIVTLILLVLVGTIALVNNLAVLDSQLRLSELLAAVEAGLNDLLLIGAAVAFLVTLENRIKRQRSLNALHELRSLVHVIDMHQLTKDPTRLLLVRQDTKSSPKEQLSAFQLQRYLDYCSEMLSLIGKVAALYAQDLSDSVVISAVNEIESLTASLSSKIWQKIMIIHNLEATRTEYVSDIPMAPQMPTDPEPPATEATVIGLDEGNDEDG